MEEAAGRNPKAEGLTKEEAIQFFNDRKGERAYDVTEQHDTAWVSACGSGSPLGKNVPLSLEYWPASAPGDDVITITDADGTLRDYTAFYSTGDRLKNEYCRKVESPAVLECIEFRTWGFELVRYDSSIPDEDRVCYAATYVSGSVAAADGQAGEGKENCIEEQGTAYSWEYTGLKLDTGTGGTSCQYEFIIYNTSDEDQYFVLYKVFDNVAMQSDKWTVRQLSAQGEFEYRFSNTRYNNGDETFDFADKLLVIRGTSECYPLTRSDDPKNLALWEEHAVPLENPCW